MLQNVKRFYWKATRSAVAEAGSNGPVRSTGQGQPSRTAINKPERTPRRQTYSQQAAGARLSGHLLDDDFLAHQQVLVCLAERCPKGTQTPVTTIVRR